MIIILRGLPASGKSTFAKKLQRVVRLNRDTTREEVFPNSEFSREREELITRMHEDMARAALKAGQTVVIDDMNLRERYVHRWVDISGGDYSIVDFPVDVDEAVARDATRPVPVGEDVIRDIAKRLTDNGTPRPYTPRPVSVPKPYVPNPFNPPVVVVDIDGTLARHTNRTPHEYHKVGDDVLIQPIYNLVSVLERFMYVVYLSVRPETCREDTENWLRRNALPEGPLFMRAQGDGRPDYIVKSELFDEHVSEKYNVRYVLDDRNSVVKMWRDKGLTVLQVADGDF